MKKKCKKTSITLSGNITKELLQYFGGKCNFYKRFRRGDLRQLAPRKKLLKNREKTFYNETLVLKSLAREFFYFWQNIEIGLR